MFRLFLTYQLIVAVAAGPLLCCCTTGRLLGSATAQPAGSVSSVQAPVSASNTHSCCSHKHHSPTPNPSDHAPDPSKAPGKCPCKDGTETPQAVPAEFTAVDVSTFLQTVPLDALSPLVIAGGSSCLSQCGHGSSPARGWNSALPSTDDLLFAHHNLRC